MKEVLDKWDIAYLDLYSGSTLQGISYSELLKVDSDTYLKDNLHLNAEDMKQYHHIFTCG